MRPDRSSHTFAFDDSAERLLEKKKAFLRDIAAESKKGVKLAPRSQTLATVYNAVNARIFFGDVIKPRTLVAAGFGATGLALLFGPEIFIAVNPDSWKGIGLSALGTLFFSFGNMASRRNSAEGIAPVTANAWGMSYGSIALLALIGITGTPIVLPPNQTYLAALVYLSVIGSVVGFTTYLMLVSRIGSQKAAYATVLFPVVALTLSSLYEDYHFTPLAMVGLALTLAGNAVMFARLPHRQPVTAAEPVELKA